MNLPENNFNGTFPSFVHAGTTSGDLYIVGTTLYTVLESGMLGICISYAPKINSTIAHNLCCSVSPRSITKYNIYIFYGKRLLHR